jgi:hypothetical protein
MGTGPREFRIIRSHSRSTDAHFPDLQSERGRRGLINNNNSWGNRMLCMRRVGWRVDLVQHARKQRLAKPPIVHSAKATPHRRQA